MLEFIELFNEGSCGGQDGKVMLRRTKEDKLGQGELSWKRLEDVSLVRISDVS